MHHPKDFSGHFRMYADYISVNLRTQQSGAKFVKFLHDNKYFSYIQVYVNKKLPSYKNHYIIADFS